MAVYTQATIFDYHPGLPPTALCCFVPSATASSTPFPEWEEHQQLFDWNTDWRGGDQSSILWFDLQRKEYSDKNTKERIVWNAPLSSLL